MLPEGPGVELDRSTWEVPPIFPFLQEKGNLSLEEMYGIFNMGIGMAIVVREKDAKQAIQAIQETGEQSMVIGKDVTRSEERRVGKESRSSREQRRDEKKIR